MRSSLDYAGLAQLCGRSPIMRKIMRAHNRIIPPSLTLAMVVDISGSGTGCSTLIIIVIIIKIVHRVQSIWEFMAPHLPVNATKGNRPTQVCLKMAVKMVSVCACTCFHYNVLFFLLYTFNSNSNMFYRCVYTFKISGALVSITMYSSFYYILSTVTLTCSTDVFTPSRSLVVCHQDLLLCCYSLTGWLYNFTYSWWCHSICNRLSTIGMSLDTCA